MRLIQWNENGTCGVGMIGDDGASLQLRDVSSVYELAIRAIDDNKSLEQLATSLAAAEVDYNRLLEEGYILPPLTHPDPARMMISGTGLTHLGSAQTRDDMHAKKSDDSPQTDSMRMFRLGVEGGKPPAGKFYGAQPEWFYKGDGSNVVAPGGDIIYPSYASDGGEEPEIVGLYIIDHNQQPRRIGFVLGNEYSDHIMEKENYLWLAHSKLRQCALGAEILLGELPPAVSGTSIVRRSGEIIWQKPFFSGEEHMCHSIANLERHHFKYDNFCMPHTVHAHFFGTATLSFADGISAQDGDEFIIESPTFGSPLINRLRFQPTPVCRDIKSL